MKKAQARKLKVLVIGQNKGGTGKTSLTRCIGEYLARTGSKVLLIDLDPQCNLSQRYLEMQSDPSHPDGILPPLHPDFNPDEETSEWNGRSSIADIFEGLEVYPYPTREENLDLLPGDGERLRQVELVAASRVRELVHQQINRFLQDPNFETLYDYVLIDTAPSKGPLTNAAIQAGTHLLIPGIMEPMSVEGIRGMLGLWKREDRRRSNEELPALSIVGIVANKFRPRTALHAGTRQSLSDDALIGPLMINADIELIAAIPEVDHPNSRIRSIFDLPKSNKARQQIEAVANEVLSRMNV